MKRYWALIVMLSVLGAWAARCEARPDAELNALLQKVTIVTCIEPPYQMQEKGQLTGVSVELVQLMLKEAGVKAKIQVLPWARAYRMALQDENVMLFSILRNPQRENLFQWVGTLHPFQVYFYRLKDRPEIVVNTLADAKKYQIGVLRDDSRNIYLRSQGFEANLDEVTLDSQNIKKLFAKRIDLLPSDPIVLAYWFKTLNDDPATEQQYDLAQLEQIFRMEGADGENYIAMSLNTDNRVVEHFRQALNRVKARPQYKAILGKYLKNNVRRPVTQ